MSNTISKPWLKKLILSLQNDKVSNPRNCPIVQVLEFFPQINAILDCVKNFIEENDDSIWTNDSLKFALVKLDKFHICNCLCSIDGLVRTEENLKQLNLNGVLALQCSCLSHIGHCGDGSMAAVSCIDRDNEIARFLNSVGSHKNFVELCRKTQFPSKKYLLGPDGEEINSELFNDEHPLTSMCTKIPRGQQAILHRPPPPGSRVTSTQAHSVQRAMTTATAVTSSSNAPLEMPRTVSDKASSNNGSLLCSSRNVRSSVNLDVMSGMCSSQHQQQKNLRDYESCESLLRDTSFRVSGTHSPQFQTQPEFPSTQVTPDSSQLPFEMSDNDINGENGLSSIRGLHSIILNTSSASNASRSEPLTQSQCSEPLTQSLQDSQQEYDAENSRMQFQRPLESYCYWVDDSPKDVRQHSSLQLSSPVSTFQSQSQSQSSRGIRIASKWLEESSRWISSSSNISSTSSRKRRAPSSRAESQLKRSATPSHSRGLQIAMRWLSGAK